MIFISNSITDQYNTKYDEDSIVYTHDSNSDLFSHYEFFAYRKFKSHWYNGVKMFADYGQHYFGGSSAIVCATTGDFDFTPHMEKLKQSPDNTIVFNECFLRGSKTNVWEAPYSIVPVGIPNFFVARYPAFMHLVSCWKWIESYSSEPELMSTDTIGNLLYRTVCHRNLQYTALRLKTNDGEYIDL